MAYGYSPYGQYGQPDPNQPQGNPAFGEVPPVVDPNAPIPYATVPAAQVPRPNPVGQAANTAVGLGTTYGINSAIGGAGAAESAAAAHSLGGAAASQAGVAPTAGLGIVPLGVGAVGVAGTLAARDYANRHRLGTANSIVQAGNPVNQAAEAFSAYGNLKGGRGLSDQQSIALALPTFGGSLAYNTVTGAGKHKDVYQRMGVKKQLDAAGLGKDLSWQGAGGQTLNMRDAQYNTDPNNPFTDQAIGYANPFAFAFADQLGMGDNARKGATDLTGQLANTLTQGAKSVEDVKSNILGFIQKMNITPDQIRSKLKEMLERKAISQQEADAFNAAISNLTSGKGGQDLTKPVGPTTSAASVPNRNGGKPTQAMSQSNTMTNQRK